MDIVQLILIFAICLDYFCFSALSILLKCSIMDFDLIIFSVLVVLVVVLLPVKFNYNRSRLDIVNFAIFIIIIFVCVRRNICSIVKILIIRICEKRLVFSYEICVLFSNLVPCGKSVRFYGIEWMQHEIRKKRIVFLFWITAANWNLKRNENNLAK